MATDPPFTRFANAVASRESALRESTPNVLNMTGSLQDIAAKTGSPGGPIQASEIPSVAGLASQQAYINTSSLARQASTKEQVKQMPAYVSSYRNYLMWRYPSRYGKKSSGTNYSTDFTQSGADIADIADPFAPPGFK